jgi:uncharacterized protein involved in response to NO
MQPILNQASPAYPAILNLGFRLFFAAAALFSVFSILAWAGIYSAGWDLQSMALSPATWHAHEMIFGYSQAVIAGFLLTAVGNWTGKQMLHGYPLLALLLLWLAARVLFLVEDNISIALLAGVDCAFTIFLIIALLIPILQAGQMKQLGIISKLVLMLASNLLFYAGMLGLLEDGMRIGLYSGIYLVVALILVLARRVFPFFIERGVGYTVELRNRTWLDMSSLVLFLAFWVADILRPDSLPVALLALTLLALHAVRLAGWHTAGIWQKPLLWVLYLGYLWLVIAFALKAAVYFFGISPFLAVHAFSYGAIGMITLGMMSRVILGHTGRDMSSPPPALLPTFALLFTGSVTRVLLPLLAPAHYQAWIGLSQGLWVIAFTLFLFIYLPMLVRARIDGRPG